MVGATMLAVTFGAPGAPSLFCHNSTSISQQWDKILNSQQAHLEDGFVKRSKKAADMTLPYAL